MRALGKGSSKALKMFAMLNIGKPVSYVAYVKNTEELFETSSEVTDSNMEMAAKEVHSIT